MKQKIPNWVWATIIVGLLILCCIVIYLRQSRGSAMEPDQKPSMVGPVAIVVQYDQIVDVVDLGTVKENFTVTYRGENGEENTVEFAPGKARMLEASCPDHRCMIEFGWQSGGEILPIACLPNSVLVRVVDIGPEPGQEPELDGATG